MKRFFAVFLALFLVAASGAAQSFDGFQTAFSSFADAMAGSLNINATVGDTWSTAYVGGFPHFGVGLAAGATFVDKATTEDLFAALGKSLPSGLDKVGLPIPAVAATFKIGLPFIPLDIGLKAGLIPASVGDKLESLYGVQADYKNVGLSLRYALVKEKLLIPAVSIGLSANYLAGSVKKSMGSSQTMTYSAGASSWTANMSEPMLDLNWESKSLDITAQVSKKIIFFTPYAGAGLTIGKSTVKGGIDSTLTVSGTSTDPADLEAALAAAGYDVNLDSTGFRYITESTSPTVRIYGGFSLDILLVLDCQLMYVPATKNLGASVTARVQL
jgi:hypothetical protein